MDGSSKFVTKMGPDEKDKEGYLEVTVREGTSEVKVTEIVQALATISSFFGAKFEKGGGGGGGGKSSAGPSASKTQARRFGISSIPPQKPSTPRQPFNIPNQPNFPKGGPGAWMGGVK